MSTFARRQRPPYYPETDEPVTKRFPRTTREAFPCDARSAYAIEHTRRSRWIDRGCWIVAIVLLALLYSVRWQ